VRSLRQCAPLWPIAELKIVLCLTTPILPTTTTKFLVDLMDGQILKNYAFIRFIEISYVPLRLIKTLLEKEP
jgi:hypothetical protein